MRLDNGGLLSPRDIARVTCASGAKGREAEINAVVSVRKTCATSFAGATGTKSFFFCLYALSTGFIRR